MFRCTNARFVVTALFVGTIAMQAVPAEAAVSKADKAVLKRAIVACKAEAKGKKIKWLSRRKYVNNCVKEAMKDHPNMDVSAMLKNRPNLTDLPVEQWPGY